MSQNYTPLFIALRYLRGRKSGFLSFISALAFISTSLGVAVLIIVSSVMNGFEKELKERVLNVIPHASIYGINTLEYWEKFVLFFWGIFIFLILFPKYITLIFFSSTL